MDFGMGAMSSLIPKLGKLLIQEYNLKDSVKKGIGDLRDELVSMQGALVKVSSAPLDQLDLEVKIWANEVRELSYAIEDSLDSLMRVEGVDQQTKPKIKHLLRKDHNVRHVIAADIISDIESQVMKIKKKYERYKINDIVANLASTAVDPRLSDLVGIGKPRIEGRRERYSRIDDIVANLASTAADPRLSALYDLVGIGEPIEELMKVLFEGADTSQKELKIVSVVGFGGLGKTTLAKALYDKLSKTYECQGFVPVGRNQGAKKVLSDILFELDIDLYRAAERMDERQLINQLQKVLAGKRYFIVIDDLWYIETWGIIKCAFVDSHPESKIIITTRIVDVAARAGRIYHMKPLSNDNSKLLFFTRTCGGEEVCRDNQPDEVINKILKKCGGVPLAIITIASLLVGKPSADWSKVYDAIGFGHEDSEVIQNTRKILYFSFYDLPSNLKTCLLYLSMFPEDYFIEKKPLIWRWVIEGFVPDKEGMGSYELGEIYFNKLVNKSMIRWLEPNKLDGSNEQGGCRVHDMVLDLIRTMSSDINFVTVYDMEQHNTHLPGKRTNRVRRLALHGRSVEHSSSIEMKQVRSFNAITCGDSKLPLLLSFNVLRVLVIEDCGFLECHSLEHLGKLVHLRYLGLVKSKVNKLPEGIGHDLKFLQILDVRGGSISELPPSVGELQNLRCLWADEGTSMKGEIGKLTCLEELHLHLVDKCPNFFMDLGKLTNLRMLQIQFNECEETAGKALAESLCKLHKIQSLIIWRIKFDEDRDFFNTEFYVRFGSLEDLAPSSKLHFFCLRSIVIPRMPSWINYLCVPLLSYLWLYVEVVETRGLQALGRLPLLILLFLESGEEKCISYTFGSYEFHKLRCLATNIEITIGEGALPMLEALTYRACAGRKDNLVPWNSNSRSLDNVMCRLDCADSGRREVKAAKAVLRKAARAHPNAEDFQLKIYIQNYTRKAAQLIDGLGSILNGLDRPDGEEITADRRELRCMITSLETLLRDGDEHRVGRYGEQELHGLVTKFKSLLHDDASTNQQEELDNSDATDGDDNDTGTEDDTDDDNVDNGDNDDDDDEGANDDSKQKEGKMENSNSFSLLVPEMDIPITAWIDVAMEGPVTASLGPMAPLLQQVHSLLAMAPEHIQGGSVADAKRLKEHLEVLCRDLLEPEETSSTPKWWRKEVRELLYDTEDRLDEVIIIQAGDFSELIAGVEDACERRKRLQLAPNKTTKPDLAEAGLSYFTPQRTSVELSKPISVQGHPAGLGVVGIEDPMNKLVDQLAFDDDMQNRLKVIPIIGFPGVGKTTVAGILYYEYRGKFQCSAFVRVSRTPDTRSLLISILSQIKAPGLCGFPDAHDLIDGIRKHLIGKRYFIIMDDLWTASIWDIISRAFPDADCGSRIITTTQIDDVALACCRYYPDYIEMSPLNDEQSKELFFTRVFGSEDQCPPDFQKVSCKIINKCAGLPLAIVSIANLLTSESHLIVDKWENIQDSLHCTRTIRTSEGVKGLCTDTAIGSGDVMLARGPKIEKWKHTQDSLPFTSEVLKQVLNLVYDNLPTHLKSCLLYLCMYPEGYLVRKNDLVRQWVAEGFVNAMGGRGAEETAGVYFDELVSRGMVQAAATNYSNEVLLCTVHYMVLDLIRHKSKELNFIITVDNLQSTLALPDEIRRLSVQFGGSKGADVPENILISKVRSLLFWGFFECVPSVVDYALLRVLILHIWADGEETNFDLTSISELLLLRYLKIQCNIMVNLPDEIKGLKCLETLEVDARLSAVPCDIGHLKKLLHLLLPSEAILPKGLDGLASLLTLGCFDLSKNSTQNVLDLAELTNLQDVHLTYSTVPSELPVGSMEHIGSILEQFNDLRSLTLHGARSSSQIISDDGLSIVSPSPSLLEKLELLPRICTLSRLPKWIGELSRLSILKIEVLDLPIIDIAILKELASLASLSLSVRTEHAEWIIFDSEGFPVLKYFKFVCTAPYMSFLEGAMPNVQKLKLAFDANRLKPEYSPRTFGFQHMTSLTQVSVKFGGAGADDSNKKDAERVWKGAFTNHPNNPILDARWVDCIFNGVKTTDVEDTKGHDRRASTSPDTI